MDEPYSVPRAEERSPPHQIRAKFSVQAHVVVGTVGSGVACGSEQVDHAPQERATWVDDLASVIKLAYKRLKLPASTGLPIPPVL